MLAKLFAFFLILSITYTGGVLIFPQVFDTYGVLEWNKKIREVKKFLDTDRADFGTGSIVEQVSNIAKPYIEESKNVVKEAKETLDTKTEEAKQAIESVEKVYDAVDTAKKDIQTLTKFSTGTSSGNY